MADPQPSDDAPAPQHRIYHSHAEATTEGLPEDDIDYEFDLGPDDTGTFKVKYKANAKGPTTFYGKGTVGAGGVLSMDNDIQIAIEQPSQPLVMPSTLPAIPLFGNAFNATRTDAFNRKQLSAGGPDGGFDIPANSMTLPHSAPRSVAPESAPASGTPLPPGTYPANGLEKHGHPYQYDFDMGANGSGRFTFTWSASNILYRGTGTIENGVPQLQSVDITNGGAIDPKTGKPAIKTIARGTDPFATIFPEVDQDAAAQLRALGQSHGHGVAAPSNGPQPVSDATLNWYNSLSQDEQAGLRNRRPEMAPQAAVHPNYKQQLAPQPGTHAASAPSMLDGAPLNGTAKRLTADGSVIRSEFDYSNGWHIDVTMTSDPRGGSTFRQTATHGTNRVDVTGSINARGIAAVESFTPSYDSKNPPGCTLDKDDALLGVFNAQRVARGQLGQGLPTPKNPAAQAAPQ